MSTTEARASIQASPFEWVQRVGAQYSLTPGRIAVIYAALGLVALYISDVVFVRYLSDPLLSRLQAIKGFVEVLLTALLIFGLTRRSHRQLRARKHHVERVKDELRLLHRVMRHNLRNDLNIIHGHANLAKRAIDDGAPDEHCDTILDTTEDMIEYTDHARRIRKVSETTRARQPIDLSSLVHRIVASHPRVTAEVGVTTSVPEDVAVEANPLLEDAVAELVTNAIKHNAASTPRVAIDVTVTGDEGVDLCIEDNGGGIPEAELDALSAAHEDQTRHSAGLGLWFVDWTATHSGGELTIENRGTGTRVCLSLPAARAG